jgi:hypothetical protein
MADYLDEERTTARRRVEQAILTLADKADEPGEGERIVSLLDDLVMAERAEAEAEARSAGYLEAQMNFDDGS